MNDQPSSNDYGHEEESDGKVITGTYFVLLPDGRRQVVHYKADHSGYTADVTYEGEAKTYSLYRPADEQPRNYDPTYTTRQYPRPYYQSYPRYSYPVYSRPAYQAYSVQAPVPEETAKPSEAPDVVVEHQHEISISDVDVAEVSTEQVSAIAEGSENTLSPDEPATEQAPVTDRALDLEVATEDLIILTEVPAVEEIPVTEISVEEAATTEAIYQ